MGERDRVFPRERAQQLENPAAWVEAHRRFYVNLVRDTKNGDFLVLDPISLDESAPLVRVPAKAFKGKLTTIDPTKIKSGEQWLTEYTKMYGNLLFRPSDRKMLVLDPATLDVRAPVTEYEQPRSGHDALVDLLDSRADEEVRARAEAHLQVLSTERAAEVEALNRTFREAEQRLLETVAEWRNADAETRSTLHLQHRIGELQKQLVDLDAARRQARYPHRYIASMSIPRLMTQPDTRDESKIDIFCTVHKVLDAKDRIIGEDTA